MVHGTVPHYTLRLRIILPRKDRTSVQAQLSRRLNYLCYGSHKCLAVTDPITINSLTLTYPH